MPFARLHVPYVASTRCTFEKADVAVFMKQARAAGKQWDVVILDPPKLAPNRKSLQGATHKYRTLNQLAMQIVRCGCYTCVGAVE